MHRKYTLLLFCLLLIQVQYIIGQSTTEIKVDASISTGEITPLWQDFYEMHLIFGWGGNPYFSGAHQQFIDDVTFPGEMNKLQPRYIRVSSGRFESPPDSTYFSKNIQTLKNLWTEFYKGPSTLAGADNLSNYDFTYVDSLSDVVISIGAEPFFDLAYMPFVLSSDQTPDYPGTVPLTHLYSWDNSIRNSPPSNIEVYGRVMYQLINHLYQLKGVKYFELWNEPDQFPLNTFFWKGTSTQLFEMYASVVDEIDKDTLLRNNIQIGCCGFAMNSVANLFPLSFLDQIQDNNIRMDFISFHPYSSSQMGGYDSTRVNQVEAWRNTFVPGAELINSEWGILSSSFGSDGWSDLDYGLEKTKALIHMDKKNIRMAHQATLADIDKTTINCCLGQYYVSPDFSPKPSAFVSYNLNKLIKTPIRIHSQLSNDNFAIAGKSVTGDTITIVFPADNPISTNTIKLSIQNLAWNNGLAKRYELTENSFIANQIFNLVDSSNVNDFSFKDTLEYQSDGNSGRLIVWELTKSLQSSTKDITQDHFRIFPNPSNGIVNVAVIDIYTHFELTLTNSTGSRVASFESDENGSNVKFILPSAGIYFVTLRTVDANLTRKIINH